MAKSTAPDRPPRALADLEEIRRHLVVTIRRVCPPSLAAEAEDLVQRALIKLMKSKFPGEGKGRLNASYLWRVATTAVIDEIRRRDRRREVSLTDNAPISTPASPLPDPEREAGSRAIGDAIRDCLTRMADARRRAVTLRLVGHTVPEIARLLGWRPKQADNRVYRGMQDLRTCLTAKGVTP